MPRGGKQPGAGRPRTRGETARSVTVRLTAYEAALLAAVETELALSGSEALRRALQMLADHEQPHYRCRRG